MALYFTEAIAVGFNAWSSCYSIWGAIACKDEDKLACGSNFKPEQALHITSAILSCVITVASFVSTFIVCYYRRVIWSV